MLEVEKQRMVVSNHVTNYMEKNKKLIPESIRENENHLSHIHDIAVSIMCTKWKVSYPGGTFAQSVVDNNLSKTFGYADDVCREAIYFFVVMLNNLDMPIEIVAVRLNEDHDKYLELTKGLH